MRIIETADLERAARLLEPPLRDQTRLRRRVAAIVSSVRRDGDGALDRFRSRFDGLAGPIEIDRDSIESLAHEAPAPVRRAIGTAARHIREVAGAQRPCETRVRPVPGVVVFNRVVPLARVGCYVPGGRYPLPSSLLMTAIPARVAGVPEVVVACPRPTPVVMAAALEAGVSRVFAMGGAHAIAALAYGTARVPRVDRIVGPGNRYVSTAKALVAPDCGIDFFAGPSELVVVSRAGRADWIAADLLAQAEHDTDARVIFITTSRRLARLVAGEVARRVPDAGPAREALEHNGRIGLVRNLAEAAALVNRLAPEHVHTDEEDVARRVLVAGTVFVGPWTVPAAGDYLTGSNHVLPTSGAARFRGALATSDFVRVVAEQRLTRHGLARLTPAAVTLARAEGLEQHARSFEVRMS